MTQIVIFGNGKIADVVHSSIGDSPEVSVAGFTCERAYIDRPRFHDLPVVPFEDVETAFPPARFAMLVAVGYQAVNSLRSERCEQARTKGYRLASWISPHAHAPKDCTVGANCFVMEGASLQPYCRLGDDVFVWSGAVVGHHASIGDHAWLASNCTVSSTARIGPHCFIGVNAAIGHGISIGARSIIGAGAIITHDTADDGVYVVPDTARFRLDSRRFGKITRLE
jgi:sugar O-acyltransferase (sialic acid O-acetyltransferase NeuD family)